MLIVNGKESGEAKFDPRENWRSERTFIIKPGATKEMVEMGVLKAFMELETEMKNFVHPRCWRFVQYFRKNPDPPRQGVIGWKYEGRKLNPQ